MSIFKKIIVGADHAGYLLKEHLIAALQEQNIPIEDMGCDSEGACDYPDFAHKVAQEVLKTPEAMGLLICGSGTGMCITANRYPHIRAALCVNEEYARLARAHDNANVLCLGARFIAPETAERLIHIFLTTPFDGGRHERRVNKIER